MAGALLRYQDTWDGDHRSEKDMTDQEKVLLGISRFLSYEGWYFVDRNHRFSFALAMNLQ